ncbi:MAG: hypothetical protein JWP14_394 [Frankiales bacterium]|nr:hypothetical protein [Frankiales bacterium]
MTLVDFSINGQPFDLDAAAVRRVMHGHSPDPIQQHAVLLGDIEYPVKQVLSMVTGLARTDFTSQTAQRVLARLGFALSAQGAPVKPSRSASTQRGSKQEYDTEWAWEGHVQDLFAAFVTTHGWTITSMADTATKAHGVDVLASKGSRLLGAEVKGWPSAGLRGSSAGSRG